MTVTAKARIITYLIMVAITLTIGCVFIYILPPIPLERFIMAGVALGFVARQLMRIYEN
jgi:hypothetical protein